jgi:hypothetical protein
MKKPASFSQAESIRSIIKKEKRRNNMRKKRIMALLLAGTMFGVDGAICGVERWRDLWKTAEYA